MLITATTGQENFQNCGCAVYLFAVPAHGHQGGGKEMHLAYAAKDGVFGCRRNGTLQVTPAAPQHIDEYGKWYRGSYDIPEGMVLKVFTKRKIAEQTAGRHQQQAAYLRAREGAALIRVTVRTTGSDIGSFNSVHIEGRFDVLTMEQALSLGVVINPMFRTQLQDHGLISHAEVSAAREAPPVVRETRIQTPEGGEVVIRRTGRGRALDL